MPIIYVINIVFLFTIYLSAPCFCLATSTFLENRLRVKAIGKNLPFSGFNQACDKYFEVTS